MGTLDSLQTVRVFLQRESDAQDRKSMPKEEQELQFIVLGDISFFGRTQTTEQLPSIYLTSCLRDPKYP